MQTRLTNSATAEIRAAMARQQIKIGPLADKMGTHPSWVRRRLNGQVVPTLDDLELLCEALDLDASTVLSGRSA